MPPRTGRPPLPADQRRVMISLRVPPETAQDLRELATPDDSQGDIVARLVSREKVRRKRARK